MRRIGDGVKVKDGFARNYLLDLSYQGSGGIGLIERWQVNTFPIDYFAGNLTQQNVVRAAAQNYRPWTNFGDIRLRSNFGHSTYHGGTAKVEKRYSDGLFFSTFYTWSKAIDSQDNDNDGTGIAPIQNRGLEKARAGLAAYWPTPRKQYSRSPLPPRPRRYRPEEPAG